MLGWFQGERVGRKCKREGERETGKEGGTERRRERKEIKGNKGKYNCKEISSFQKQWEAYQDQNLMKSFLYVYICSVQKVSRHVIWKIETFIGEDTRYKEQCT